MTGGGRLSYESKKGSRVTTLTNGLGGPPITSPLAPLVFDPVLGIVPHSESGKRKETNVSPMVNVQYRVTDDAMAYLSASRGYKSGGFDARSNKPVAQGGTFEFEDERATTYEFGVKSGIGGRAEISAAAFFTDYKDLQTSAFDGAIGFNVGNGSAEIRGIELEGRWRPVRSFLLTGSLAVLDFDWTRYQGQCYYDRLLAAPTVANCNYAGRTNQLAPNFTGYVSAEYSWAIGGNLTLKTTADVVHTSSFLQSLNLDPAATQQAYSKLNARIALGGNDDHWELAVVGRNLTDKTTVSYAGDTPLAFRLFRARSYYGFVDPPRSVAIEVRLKF
jgi:outer membrane receptor protein involved in Fe transport